MIECKFSLELTRNGVQKSIHAKAGEEDGRKAVITLTESGKVFDASTYKLRMFFDDETYSDKVELVNGCVEFVLPAALTSVAGERLCELKLSKGDRAAIYSPVFRVLVEGSIGADAEEEAKLIGSPVRYQEVIPALSEGASVFPDDEIAVYTPEDDLTTKRKVSSLPFSKKLENEAVLERIGANENGLTLDDEEISSDPIATTLQMLAAMIAADTALFRASIEPPDFASTDESFFYSILSSSVMNNEPGYYAPPSSGQLRYTDPTNNEEMLMPVIRGIVYKFSFDNATYQLQIRTLDSKDDVAELCKIVHRKYAEISEIPKNISQLENDRKFVSSGKVETMINEATAKIRELTEDEANNLTANTEARHVHENKSVLDNLGENEDGDLTYKGKVVGGTAEKPLILIEPKDDYATGKIHADITNCITIETSMLPQNARVKKIEIPKINFDTNEATEEYIQLEDMVAYDPNGFSTPYYIMYPKNVQGSYFTVAANVVFTVGGNNFYNAIGAFVFDEKTIKIYYEIEE